MNQLAFSKWQGAGNDFVILDWVEKQPLAGLERAQARRDDRPPDPIEAVRRLAPLLCHRHRGVGADGVLLLLEPTVASAQVRMVVINPDGSLAEMCGNGLRCVARYWVSRGSYIEPPLTGTGEDLAVETGAGILFPRVLPPGQVQVDMGAPIFDPKLIPLDFSGSGPILDYALEGASLRFSALSMGNPHAVTFEGAGVIDPTDLGPKIGRLPCFPQGVNVGFAQARGRHAIELMVWERGAGLTQACGTGACAAVVAGILTGRLTSPVSVAMPGGVIVVHWTQAETVKMTGPAEPVFTGLIPLTDAYQGL